MIPPFFDETTVSNGEKKVFRVLESLHNDYIILHSLGVAAHQEKVFGEIDFVIICEDGILCLEVKGGSVRREQGLWYFTDRHGRETAKTEGPFRQVFTVMHSLRQHLRRQFGPNDSASTCQFACGVVFPDMPFPWKGPDIVPEIIFDARRNPEDIAGYIGEVFAYWRDLLLEKHGFAGGRLNRAQIERVSTYLRGDFGFVPSLGYIVEKTDKRLLALTREQADRLAMASENPRILLKGTAGTGKTLLGLEYARRCAVTGKDVLFLCFNRNLSRYLQIQTQQSDPFRTNPIQIDTLHGYLIRYLKSQGCLPSATGISEDGYYRRTVPEAFVIAAEQNGYDPKHNVIIVDEGQDLLKLGYILCMDVLLRGGLREGNWHISLDPNQNIFNPDLDEGLAMIQEFRPVILNLDINCRNTWEIGVYNVLATGMPPTRYFKIRGEGVFREGYNDMADQRRLVIKAVKRLIAQGVPPGKICLLSKYRYENSCLQGNNIFQGICQFQNVTNLNPTIVVADSLKFCTIHSFKGLEAPAVFLLDVDSFVDDQARLLNYIAISRATSLLYILHKKGLDREWETLVQRSASLLNRIEDHELDYDILRAT
ncbi:MAG: nuclease-related domain-containing DEAD/DEAH box helicase [Candidatus Desulforudaceae bacterium]